MQLSSPILGLFSQTRDRGPLISIRYRYKERDEEEPSIESIGKKGKANSDESYVVTGCRTVLFVHEALMSE